MPFVSVTRLRLRSIRFLPAFALQTLGTLRQAGAAPGFRDGSLLPDRRWTFWTMTLWDDRDAMRAYMTAGAHRTAMPKLLGWCDEASVVHWDTPDTALPGWADAAARMRLDGRPSKVRRPSADHAAMTFSDPRLTRAAPIRSQAMPLGN